MSHRWNAVQGRLPDETLRDRITIHCGQPDKIGKCRLRADLDGTPLYYDTIDPFNAHFRKLFVEAAYTKADGAPPEDHFDLGWLGDKVIAAAESVSVSTSASREIESYKPFPIGVLPIIVADYVRAASCAIGCDPSFIALPLMACLARAIGNKRAIRLKRTWTEPAIIWAAIIGKSGTHKSPALTAATSFLNRHQAKSIAAFDEAVARYDQDKALYDRDYAAWKRSKSTEPPPWQPEVPVCQRFVTTDCTIEALAFLLHSQFDGVLVPRDELAGWLGGIAEYKGGKGSDLGHWLASWSASPLTVDRKTGAIKMIHVPRAAVSIVGGIQPGVLRKAIGQEHMQDGLCARLLLAMPDPKPVRWTDAIVDPPTEAAMGNVFERLLSLDPAGDEDGKPCPMPMPLTDTAKPVWVEYFNRHRAELTDLDDDLAAAWSKLEAYTARFALIFQLCAWAAGEQGASDQVIDEAAMRSAILLSDWFGGEARRVYGLFAESNVDREQRELVEWIRRKGGRVTAREAQQGHRRFKTADEAEAALTELFEAGFGQWSLTPTATKPRREFILSTPSTSTDSPESRELDESVDVDTVDDWKTHTRNGHGDNPF
jgi:hypothetical protein